MASTAVARLVDLLTQSELLTAEQQEQLAELQARCPDPRALARELIERGWLTPFQMEFVMLGHLEHLSVGPYRLLDVIGEGAMGQVYKARHHKLGHVVALKLMREDQQADPRIMKRFRREIRALVRLAHPNIVTARDIDEIDRGRFFAMEYVEGVNLHDVIKECRSLPLAPVLDYLRQAAIGLQHAYEKGLIHRDIKPANFLITPPPAPADRTAREGRWGVLKLLDLGLALLQQRTGERSDSQTHLTAKGLMLGTVDYVAPEQVMSPHDVDIRADLYSLGCTFYEMLTGQVPFPHGSPAKKLLCHQETEPLPVEQFRPMLPPEVALVVRKLMAKSPGERFQTPAHLANTLATLLAGLPVEAVDWDWRPPNLVGYAPVDVSHLSRPAAVDWGWVVLVAAAVVGIGVGVLVFALTRGG